jgi:Ca2+-transporting ATPase
MINQGTILDAVEEGKTIFSNIKCFLVFQLSTSCGALMIVASSTLLGFPSPLNPMQILWINIICDGPVAQSLGVEPKDETRVNLPPRKADEQIITRLLLYRVFCTSILMAFGTLLVFSRDLIDGEITKKDRTLVFTCLVLFDLWNSLSCRSENLSIFEVGFFRNQMFNYAFSFVFMGQFLVVNVPFIQSVFQTVSLSVWEWIYLIALTSSVFWIEELRKRIYKNSSNNKFEYSAV